MSFPLDSRARLLLSCGHVVAGKPTSQRKRCFVCYAMRSVVPVDTPVRAMQYINDLERQGMNRSAANAMRERHALVRNWTAEEIRAAFPEFR